MKAMVVGAPHTSPAGWVIELTAKGTSPQNADCHDTWVVVVGIGVGEGATIVERSLSLAR